MRTQSRVCSHVAVRVSPATWQGEAIENDVEVVENDLGVVRDLEVGRTGGPEGGVHLDIGQVFLIREDLHQRRRQHPTDAAVAYCIESNLPQIGKPNSQVGYGLE